MSQADSGHDLHGVPEELRTFGDFELEPMFDESEQPQEITVFDAAADDEMLVERWITCDVETAVPMEDCR